MSVAPASHLLEEITSFLAAAPSAEAIIAYVPPAALDERLHYLLDQNSRDEITSTEQDELDEYLLLSHFLKMLKLKTRLKLTEVE